MRLNLASGRHPTSLPDWLNLDLPWDGVEPPHLYADAFALPFPARSMDGAYLGHVAEHIEWEALPAFFGELRRVLRDKATVMLVGPCIARALHQHEPLNILEAIIGEGTGPGAHKWVPTEALTLKAIRRVFPTAVVVDVRDVRAPEWPNPTQATWQCAIRATCERP